jgi:hypothetical protein
VIDLLRLGVMRPTQAEDEAGQRAYAAANPVRVRDWLDLEPDERLDWIIQAVTR